jgi:hypothetical protein
MILPIKFFIKYKQYIQLVFLLLFLLLFLFAHGLTWFAIIVGMINIVFVYLFFRYQYDFINYSLFFIIIYTFMEVIYKSAYSGIYIVLLLVACVIQLYLYLNKKFSSEKDKLFSILILMSVAQVIVVARYLDYSYILQSILLTLVFYLANGILTLYDESKINFYNVSKYAMIFIIGFILISFV